MPSKKRGPLRNEEITALQVRLIDHEGNNIGVISKREALEKARDVGLDLVEISPQVSPPVCKIMDFGKFKYEEQKRKAEARKNQKIIDVKEVKVRPNIEDHDYQVKLRNAVKFINQGDKVKVTLRFRGREMSHQKIGMDLLYRIRDDLADIAKVEQRPNMEGRQVIMVLTPL